MVYKIGGFKKHDWKLPPLDILQEIDGLKKEIVNLKKEESGVLNIKAGDFNISAGHYTKVGNIVAIYFEVDNSDELFPDGRFTITGFPPNIYPIENVILTVPASKIINSNAMDYVTFVLTPGGYAALDTPTGSGIKQIYVSATYISN